MSRPLSAQSNSRTTSGRTTCTLSASSYVVDKEWGGQKSTAYQARGYRPTVCRARVNGIVGRSYFTYARGSEEVPFPSLRVSSIAG